MSPLPVDNQQDLRKLIEDYDDYVPTGVRTRETPPTALEALRMIQADQPVILRGFDPHRSAGRRERRRSAARALNSPNVALRPEWDHPHSLCDLLGKQEVAIAITPNGMADSIQIEPETGKAHFVQPLTEQMGVKQFMANLLDEQEKEVYYLQSQDGNIYRAASRDIPDLSSEVKAGEPDIQDDEPEQRSELAALQAIFEPDVDFMTEALDAMPDAVNLWVGNARSVTSLHKGVASPLSIARDVLIQTGVTGAHRPVPDPYHNIYTLLSGSKTFTLLPPIQGYLLDHDFHPTATYQRDEAGRLQIQRDLPPGRIPWTTLDPLDLPRGSPIKPITVTVHTGESLYLPAFWWHHVQQQEGPGGVCVAVNYWYDHAIDPEKFALQRFVWRALGRPDLAGEEGESDTDTT